MPHISVTMRDIFMQFYRNIMWRLIFDHDPFSGFPGKNGLIRDTVHQSGILYILYNQLRLEFPKNACITYMLNLYMEKFHCKLFVQACLFIEATVQNHKRHIISLCCIRYNLAALNRQMPAPMLNCLSDSPTAILIL